ncbi:MAG: helix-turn-helix transcriptional regulator [Alphaproteobacteria bacterium]|nr:helix-turn-helix transcriptional regulator [Alphaproteobacteria bacterium]
MMLTLSMASLAAIIQIVVAFFLTGLLVMVARKDTRWLAGFTFFFGVSFLPYLFLEQTTEPAHRQMLVWSSWLSMFAVPCLHSYAASVMGRKPAYEWAHFLVAPLVGAVTYLLIAGGSGAIAGQILRWGVVIQVFAYGCSMLAGVWRYRVQLKQTQSNIDDLDLGWLSRLVALLIALMVADIGLFPLLELQGVDHQKAQFYFNFFSTLYLLWLARGAINQHVLPREEVSVPVPSKADTTGLDADSIKALADELALKMEKDQLFQKPTLTLGQLADELGLSRHVASEVLNKGHGRTFYDFVNDHRVEKAKALLTSTDKTVLEAAFEAGFNNKASFNRAFKERTGLTPSQYRQKIAA